MYQVVMGVGPDDDRVADKVAALADLPDADGAVAVTVVHATADTDGDVTAVDSVAAALDACERAGLDAEAVAVDDDDPAAALLATAADVDADCVCVGGRRRSPAGKLQLKSGAHRVILRADRPVLVAGQAD